MTKMLKKTISSISKAALLLAVIYGLPIVSFELSLTSGEGYSVSAAEPVRKKRRTPALREKVYSKLSNAQNLADEGKVTEGLQILEKMKGNLKRMNSYEIAMMWNFIGFIQYGENNLNQAVLAFNNVIAQKNIPESMELATIYSLAQINMQMEDYDKTLSYLNRWESLNKDGANDKSSVLKANAHYAKKQYAESLSAINKAVVFIEAKGKTPKENLLVLKRAVHFELKQPKQVTAVSEDLVRLFGKAEYWVELANMYGEIGEEHKQLAVMEAAYQQGFVTKEGDLINLSQLYYLNGAPYKSARLLEKGIADEVISKSLKNMEFLAQAWTVSKEYEQAIPVLKEAASLANDGNLYARLTEVYVNLEQWTDAVQFGRKAVKKGKLKNPGNVNVAMGMAFFNLQNFEQSIQQFEQAMEYNKVKKTAEQWKSYVAKEYQNQQQIMEAIGTI